MNKFYGVVGYVVTQEGAPGVWKPVRTEKPYYGDVIKNISRYQSTEHQNDDITVDTTP